MTSNQEQIDYWNGQAGETWVVAQTRLDSMLENLSVQAIAKADPQPGERVIDVGCGCGTTSIAMAQRGAAVWGVDISAPMLGLAKSRSKTMDNVVFTQGDASKQSLTADHDLIFSRFGVMFFDDPVVAFSNLRTGLKPGGRMVFICWQSPVNNPWVSTGGRAIQPFLPEGEPVDPKAPGPFAFADADYLSGVLKDAGFSQVELQSLEMDLIVGESLDAAMEFQGEVGPMARVLAELSGAEREQAIQAVRAALEPFVTPDGVKLGAATWLVSAQNGVSA